ncbi:MAG: DUF58 domain-containing protein [Cyclobacteriaceae bacterium]|nr:DUF58 domain-containing protein [Cyclobacteriaceae bacterium]
MKIDLNILKEYGNLEFLARQLVEGFITGLHKSPYHGFSVEFAEHRLYNTGESTRYIDWKVFARTDRLYTKQFEEETNLRCQLVIDTSPSMHYPEKTKGKLRFSIIAAAAISYLLNKQRDATGLCTFAEKIEENTPIRSSRNHLTKLLIILERLLDTPLVMRQTNVANVLHEIAEKNHRRSLIIIFSDMFDHHENQDELFTALQHLKHNQHEVLLFHVTDLPTEYDFAFDERPWEFIDLESGEKLKLKPSEVKENYRQEIRKYYHELKLKCAQYKIDFIQADIHQDFDDILKAYMIKRSKMS